jgi:hypothetical protein
MLSARAGENGSTALGKQPSRFTAWRLFVLLEIQHQSCSPLFEIAFVLVRLDHVARFILNANHGIM